MAIVTHASVAVALTAVLSMEPGQECFLEGGGASKTLLSLLERIDSARTAGETLPPRDVPQTRRLTFLCLACVFVCVLT